LASYVLIFLARCLPDPVTNDCTGSAAQILDGRTSFPSLHASMVAAGLGYFSFFLAGKLKPFADERGYLWKVIVCLAPSFLALYVGMSRYTDNRHRLIDILVGFVIGIAFAFVLPERKSRRLLYDKGWAGNAFLLAAEIALITSSGGSFAQILTTAGIQTILISPTFYQPSAGYLVPSVVGLVVKFTTGETKKSMPAAAQMVLPFLPTLNLDGDRPLVCVAIGVGSTICNFVTDDFFWILCRLSNLNMKSMVIFFTGEEKEHL